MVLWIFSVVVRGVTHFAANQVWAQAPSADVHGPFVGHAVMVGQSAEVHRLPVAPSGATGPAIEVNPRWGQPIPLPFGTPRVPDALAQGQGLPSGAARTPTATLDFDGMATSAADPCRPTRLVTWVRTTFGLPL